VAEVSIIAGEVVAGVVAGAVAGFFSGGAGALPAYCVTSVGVSAVGGAWALAGTMSEDKWVSNSLFILFQKGFIENKKCIP